MKKTLLMICAGICLAGEAYARECDTTRALRCAFSSYSGAPGTAAFLTSRAQFEKSFFQHMTDFDEAPAYNCKAELRDIIFGTGILVEVFSDTDGAADRKAYPIQYEVTFAGRRSGMKPGSSAAVFGMLLPLKNNSKGQTLVVDCNVQ